MNKDHLIKLTKKYMEIQKEIHATEFTIKSQFIKKRKLTKLLANITAQIIEATWPKPERPRIKT